MREFITNYTNNFYNSLDFIGEVMRVTFAFAATAGMIVFISVLTIACCHSLAEIIKDKIEERRQKEDAEMNEWLNGTIHIEKEGH